jgi:ring-1,2-phenylacetyl-CoA epoxidase subunit PaaD
MTPTHAPTHLTTGLDRASTPRAHAHVWAVLTPLTDPEIPVVTLEEMGILREVREVQGRLQVVITPTYSGCPAMSQIEDDVRAALRDHHIDAEVVTQLSPAWTTDWMTEHARRKLRAYGIAPPQRCASTNATASAANSHVLRFMAPATHQDAIDCPHCGSVNTTQTSAFGSTACKSLYKCLDCLEPFDYFKPH